MCTVKRPGLHQNKGSHTVEPSTSLILVKPTAEEGIAECKVRTGGKNGQFRHNRASNA
jgi:hypothetical protein